MRRIPDGVRLGFLLPGTPISSLPPPSQLPAGQSFLANGAASPGIPARAILSGAVANPNQEVAALFALLSIY